MSARGRSPRVAKPKRAPLHAALIASGASLCAGCNTYVDKDGHECRGIPAVSQRWEWDYTKPYTPTPHHDPIAQEWTELDAEDANNMPEAA